MDSGLLFQVFVFLAAACFVVPLVSRFRLGSVLGYLAAGIVIGPFGLGLIGDAAQTMHLAEFGVVMMLFIIGLELQPEMLWRMRRSILGLGGLQVVLTSLAITGIGLLLGYGLPISLTVGMALSLSSTALVLQMLQEKNLMQTAVGETSFAVLLFQDIAVIGMLVTLPLLAPEGMAAELNAHGGGWVAGLPGWGKALAVAGVIGLVIVSGRYLSHYVFHAIARTDLREVFTALSLALVVGVTLLMQQVGMSPALGAFIAGVMLAGSEYRHTLENDLEPFKGLLLGLFFISVGMGMDFSLLAKQPAGLAGAVLGLMAVKALVLLVLGRICRFSAVHYTGMALALSQGGEFAFVLFQFADGLQLLPTEQRAFLTMVVAMSIALTPLLMGFYSRYIAPWLVLPQIEREPDVITELNPVIIAGFGRFGQVVGRFLIAQGVKVTVLEKDADQVALLRRFGFQGYFGDVSRGGLLHSAGASQAKLLVIALDDMDECLRVAEEARRHFPRLKIFARARNRRHAYELHKLGVDFFKRETFDSALSLAQEAMVELGYDAGLIKRRAKKFQHHDKETLIKSFDFFDHEPDLISFSQLRAAELQQLLQEDVKDLEDQEPEDSKRVSAA